MAASTYDSASVPQGEAREAGGRVATVEDRLWRMHEVLMPIYLEYARGAKRELDHR